MQKKVVFGSLFVILAFMFMFADAQFHIGFKDKPSMALTHASHGSMEGMDHSNMEDIEDMDHSTMDMPGMIPLEDLPPEEPQSVLEPEIVIEDGKEIKVFNLWIEAIRKEIRDGIYTEGWGFNRQVPGPELRIKEGDNVRIIFENRHTKEHTIHWHGVHVPTEMDGVPSISQKPVQPNETFTYEFIAGPSGTHTYHCHVDTDHHIDMGMYGAFIIEARDEDLTIYDQDVTWMLSSFNTKKHIHNEGVSKYFSGNHQYKVEKDAFLINGKAFPSTKALTVKEGDLVKLRLIHMGKEPYSMHLHGHSFTTTHKDGFKIENPQEMDTLPILPGERYDLKIEMKNPGAWVFHDHITQHVTNDGFYPGGMLSLILYEGYDLPEHLTDLLTKIDNYKIETLKLGQPVETAKVQETKAHDDGDGHGH